jgi:acetamidase/formamidase
VVLETRDAAITPGFGFLRDLFADPLLVRWRLQDGVAVSHELPGVRIPGDPFMGIIGVAPDQRLVATSRQRESDAVDRGDFAPARRRRTAERAWARSVGDGPAVDVEDLAGHH